MTTFRVVHRQGLLRHGADSALRPLVVDIPAGVGDIFYSGQQPWTLAEWLWLLVMLRLRLSVSRALPGLKRGSLKILSQHGYNEHPSWGIRPTSPGSRLRRAECTHHCCLQWHFTAWRFRVCMGACALHNFAIWRPTVILALDHLHVPNLGHVCKWVVWVMSRVEFSLVFWTPDIIVCSL